MYSRIICCDNHGLGYINILLFVHKCHKEKTFRKAKFILKLYAEKMDRLYITWTISSVWRNNEVNSSSWDQVCLYNWKVLPGFQEGSACMHNITINENRSKEQLNKIIILITLIKSVIPSLLLHDYLKDLLSTSFSIQ